MSSREAFGVHVGSCRSCSSHEVLEGTALVVLSSRVHKKARLVWMLSMKGKFRKAWRKITFVERTLSALLANAGPFKGFKVGPGGFCSEEVVPLREERKPSPAPLPKRHFIGRKLSGKPIAIAPSEGLLNLKMSKPILEVEKR